MSSKRSKDKKSKKSENQSNTYLRKGSCKIPVQIPCPDCNDFFDINLAGLTENLNFQLLRFEDSDIEIDTASGSVKGRICKVGIDFIEIKEKDGIIVTILKDKIIQIRWLKELSTS